MSVQFVEKDRDWNEYPPGTKAFAHGGGYWFRTNFGWKWCTGDNFPTPGGDVDTNKIQLPPTTETSLRVCGRPGCTNFTGLKRFDNGMVRCSFHYGEAE